MELADRIKFDTFLKDKLTMLDLPKSWVAGTTVFDFVVSKEGMTCSQVLLEGGVLGGGGRSASPLHKTKAPTKSWNSNMFRNSIKL